MNASPNLRRFAPTLAMLTLLLLAPAVQAAADPYTGTWTLHVTKSSGAAGSQVLTIKVTGNQEIYRSELVLENGKRQVTNYTAAYDGKEYPSQTIITEADGTTTKRDDTVILLKVDARTRERHWKQGGRVVSILRRVVSQDGKTLRSQVVEVDEKGQEHANGTLVFDKQ